MKSNLGVSVSGQSLMPYSKWRDS